MKYDNILILIENIEDIDKLKSVDINKFLYPLKFFSIGFNKYYDLNEVKEENSYIYINKMMSNNDLDNLAKVLTKLPSNIKGIVFDDLGIIEIVKNLNVEKILFSSHFNLNSKSVDAMLEYVDTVIISPDLTTEETNHIISECKNRVGIYGYGYLPVTYSKRKLNTNYADYHDLNYNSKLKLKNTDFDFISIENEDGTIFYYDKVFNGLNIDYKEKPKYVLVNLFNIEVNAFFNNKYNEYKGFLENETIYKLKAGE